MAAPRVLRFVCALISLSVVAACAEPPAAPVVTPVGVSALVVDGNDNLAWEYPQIIADLIIQSSGEIALPYPIRDLNTGQYSSVLTFATLPESVSVSAGWNGTRRARMLIAGTGGSPEDSLPAAAVLRNDQYRDAKPVGFGGHDATSRATDGRKVSERVVRSKSD
jgi:hypothetical protein